MTTEIVFTSILRPSYVATEATGCGTSESIKNRNAWLQIVAKKGICFQKNDFEYCENNSNREQRKAISKCFQDRTLETPNPFGFTDTKSVNR